MRNHGDPSSAHGLPASAAAAAAAAAAESRLCAINSPRIVGRRRLPRTARSLAGRCLEMPRTPPRPAVHDN